MNPSDLADTDLVTLPSAHSESETVYRLKSLLAQKKIELFAHIDHAAGAKAVGLSLRPTQVLIFGNAQAGTPLMQSQQTIGLDLPLKVLVWVDEAGKVWLTFRRPEALTRKQFLADAMLQPQDEWERGLLEAAQDYGVSLPDSALSSEGIYD